MSWIFSISKMYLYILIIYLAYMAHCGSVVMVCMKAVPLNFCLFMLENIFPSCSYMAKRSWFKMLKKVLGLFWIFIFIMVTAQIFRSILGISSSLTYFIIFSHVNQICQPLILYSLVSLRPYLYFKSIAIYPFSPHLL